MELINYDKNNRISTINLADDELGNIFSVLVGVGATFDKQLAIVGVDEKDIDILVKNIRNIIMTHLSIKGLKVPNWKEMQLKN